MPSAFNSGSHLSLVAMVEERRVTAVRYTEPFALADQASLFVFTLCLQKIGKALDVCSMAASGMPTAHVAYWKLFLSFVKPLPGLQAGVMQEVTAANRYPDGQG